MTSSVRNPLENTPRPVLEVCFGQRGLIEIVEACDYDKLNPEDFRLLVTLRDHYGRRGDQELPDRQTDGGRPGVSVRVRKICRQVAGEPVHEGH